MISCESDLFELEENHLEFQEICSRLKNHTFPSPWKLFFKNSNETVFKTEVAEFIIENDIATQVSNQDVSCSNNVTFGDQTDVSKNLLVSLDVPIDKKKVCRLKDSLMSAQDDSTIEHIKDFDVFLTVSSLDIPLLFEMLDFSAFNDTALSLILNAFLHFKDQISASTITALVHHVIYPLIFDKKNSSRFLLSSILKFAEVFPKAVIDEILIPYSKIETPATDDLQSEVITQITKINLPSEYISYSIKSVLEHALPVDSSFTLLQCLVERKVHHDSVLYDLLLKKLSSWTSTCNKNVKFTKIVTSILSTYGNELTEEQILLCDEIVMNNKTIIKKAAENLLKRLKQGNL